LQVLPPPPSATQDPLTHLGVAGGHGVVVVTPLQRPAPLQVLTTVPLPAALQTGLVQASPAGWKLQTPAALQPASVQLLGEGQLQQRNGLPTHEPEAQSPEPVQVPPGAVLQVSLLAQARPAPQPRLLVGSQVLQAPLTQILPVAQSPSAAHGAVRQAPFWQVKAPQDIAGPAAHRAPLPGQVLAIRLSFEQLVPHAVPIAATLHLPVPSQVPLLPQMGLAASTAQPPCGGGALAATFRQVPVSQVLQPPQLETLQQTPLTQNWGLGVCLQSALSWQAPPGPAWPQRPLWQVLGAMHSALLLQPERH
jgi:hypothetical protein